MTQTTEALTAPTATKPGLVGKGQWVLFVALILCFTAWGIAADLTTPMVAGFKQIFDMSTFQASLVQFAYFGAYFLLALPAAFLNERFGYKVGLLSGLLLAAVGAFAFYPAAHIMTFAAFLVAQAVPSLPAVLDEARRLGARVPGTALIDQFYADVQAMGGGRQDTSGLIRRLR